MYHIVRVNNVEIEFPSLELVLWEFSEVFSNDLLKISLEWKINFDIDIFPNTNSISIPPYQIAPAEMKELKAQLKDLLEKGFI